MTAIEKCVKDKQRLLKKFGFEPGPVDGVAGRRTNEALLLALGAQAEPDPHDTDTQVSPSGRIKLMQHEAVMLDAYKDSKNIWTIGVGHTAFAGAPIPRRGMKLTIEEVFELFERDLRRYEHDVVVALRGTKVEQHQFDALVSFHYNTGGIKKANLMRRLRAGDIGGAARGFMGWVRPPEIKERRREEMELFRTGDYGDLSTVPMYPITANYTPNWRGRKNITAPLL